MDAESEENDAPLHTHHELTEMGKWHVYAYSSRYYDFDKCAFHYGMRKKVAGQFGISESTVNRVMKDAATFADPKAIDFSSKKVGHCGAKRQCTEGELDQITALNATHKKDSVRDFALEVSQMLGHYIPPATLQRWMHEYLNCVSKSCKPKPRLTEEQKFCRMDWILNQIDWDFKETDDSDTPLYYRDDLGVIYIDEAWIKKHKKHYNVRFLADQEMEEKDYETATSMTHVDKYMSLSGFMHPDPTLPADDTNWKICCVDIVETKEYKFKVGGKDVPYNIDANGFRALMVGKDNILQLAWEKAGHYAEPGKPVKIIMDNAPPHVGGDNVKKLNEYIKKQKWNMIVETQPPQSPDFNVMNLSIWYSLQSQVHKVRYEHATTGVLGVRAALHDIYDAYPSEKVVLGFGGLWANFNACLAHDGDNRYPRVRGHVRAKHHARQPLNVVDFTRDQLHAKKAAVEAYYAQFAPG